MPAMVPCPVFLDPMRSKLVAWLAQRLGIAESYDSNDRMARVRYGAERRRLTAILPARWERNVDSAAFWTRGKKLPQAEKCQTKINEALGYGKVPFEADIVRRPRTRLHLSLSLSPLKSTIPQPTTPTTMIPTSTPTQHIQQRTPNDDDNPLRPSSS